MFDEDDILLDPKDPEDPAQLSEFWDDHKPAIEWPPMSDDDLRSFINGVADGRIFTSVQIQEPNMIGHVFMPLLFGALGRYNVESIKTIGVFYENYDQALPRSINGYPMFTSMRMMNVTNWERTKKAILAEQERRKSIPI